ncbi:MAG: ErfK/YbiS/YcfS/YnhG family protein [Acidimicrobiales bacterium]|nr:ErfK/YbiS/YcfS/YnhG family protein [Acidimicrobiales bacterium]
MLRRSLRGLPVAVAVAVVGLGAILGFSPAASPVAPGAVRVRSAEPRSSTLAGGWKDTTKPESPLSFPVADATGPVVHLFSEIDVPLASRPTMANPTWEGLPVVFDVLEEEGPWLHVKVSARPNGLTAWILRAEVSMRTVPNHVEISLGAHLVTVYHGDHVLLREPVVIGSPVSPTPIGSFFVDGIVQVSDPGGPYGAYQVSVSGFSDTYTEFGGGIGQIAMHGTNRPDQVGQSISHGCVRMSNDAITRMAALAPLGTPVAIVA